MKKAITAVLMAVVLMGTLCSCTRIKLGNYTYDYADQYTAGSAEITEDIVSVDIDWIEGSVTLCCGGSALALSETSDGTIGDDMLVRWRIERGKLYVKYASSGKHENEIGKNLTVTLPADCKLSSVRINTVAADVTVSGITAEAAEVSTVGGKIEAEMSAGAVKLTTVSGTVRLTASDKPDSIEISGVSGSAEVVLSDDVGFRASLTSVGGKTTVEQTVTVSQNEYLHGDGACALKVNTVSSPIYIRKG